MIRVRVNSMRPSVDSPTAGLHPTNKKCVRRQCAAPWLRRSGFQHRRFSSKAAIPLCMGSGAHWIAPLPRKRDLTEIRNVCSRQQQDSDRTDRGGARWRRALATR